MSWSAAVNPGCDRKWAMLSDLPVIKLSTQMTDCPRCNKRSQRNDPIKPAPPATSVAIVDEPFSRQISGECEGDQSVALGLQKIKLPLLRRPPSLHEKRVAEVRDATSKGGYGGRKAEPDKLQSQLDEPDDP